MNATGDGVAIVGMAGRFPGAASIDEFWRNLLAGQESIAHFAPDQLSPLVPREQQAHPRYVAARGIIADADRFDAAFFGIAPGEAALIDPQQRVFLELCWNALEHAGIDPQRFAGSIGVYAGVSNNGYRKLVEARPDVVAASGEFAAMLANEKDYVTTRVAHRIGLTGPALSVYTACSTALVAVAQAWYALMSWQCDAALAGGINIVVPQESGYVPVDGGMESADGHCRPFDAGANGTVFSSGGGVVVLKRLADALAHGDAVWAVIRGVGVNNDGADKASFTAPSARGQAAAIRLALATAGVGAGAIGYVEAHGTGTALGDPIEVEALTRAYREDTGASGYCWLGSVKGNIGHLVAGAGVAGLIKAVLALHHGCIPPSLHFRRANPEIDFAATPFRVADRLIDWPRGQQPRRAGVSAFGVGGTNAHVILEEAPERAPRPAMPPAPVVLALSARDEEGVRRRAAELADALARHGDDELADVGWTLATGRRAFPVRAATVAETIAEARDRLQSLGARTAIDRPRIVFLFPGQGSQHADMARELVDSEPVFAEAFERCCALIAPLLGRDLRALILPDADARDSANVLLAHTRHSQPALFAVEYALAQLWRSFGIVPDAMIGHSVGEYAAACVAGVFSLEDAIRLVVARGMAMDAQPRGAMLAVKAPVTELAQRLPGGIELAAVNAADSVVVAGCDSDIDEFAGQLGSARIASTRLQVRHAFHSALMDAALPVFRQAFDGVSLSAPATPFYSCVSGSAITADEATSPDYWCRQIRAPVRFADAATHALDAAGAVAVEVGPGQVLSGLLRRRAELRERVVATLGPARERGSDRRHLAAAVGRLWCLGAPLDWERCCRAGQRRRVPLPGYPFRGRRCWIDPPGQAQAFGEEAAVSAERATMVSHEAQADGRSMQVRAELRELVGALSGETRTAAHDGAGFLDLGLDSLALTQMALELERRFGLRLKLRQLMEDLDSIDKLAALLGERVPAADARTRAAPVPMPTGAGLVPAPGATLAKRGNGGAFGAAARITLAPGTAFDADQHAWLRGFSERYNRRTAGSKAFAERHRNRMADPRVVTGFHPLWKELVYPIVVARSRGAYLYDIDGNEYIDLLNAFGANFLGYQPEAVRRALVEQVNTGFEIGPQHPLAAEVADLIGEMTGMERVAFCNTGSEAVMGALRIARTVTGRSTVALFRDSYHGIFDEVIVRGSAAAAALPAAPGIPANAVGNVLVLDYGAAGALEVLRERAGELAAVMIEPVQARNPELQPRGFVQALRAFCDASGCALIFDEVVTGFRISPGGAQELYGVRADIATYGKIIGGGLPLAVIASAPKWLDALDGGSWQFGDDSRPENGVTYFAGTFVRHPLALAAARATLLHLKRAGPQLQRTLNARTGALVARLNAFFEAQAAPMHALAFSSLWRIRIDDDQPFGELFYYALRERGLHVYAQFNCFLSAGHGDEEVDRIIAQIESATLELLDAGMLARKGPRAAQFAPRPARVPDAPERGAAPQPFPAQDAGPVAAARAAGALHGELPHAVPLTDAQLEKWVACRLGDTASIAFNESQLLMLEGALDRAALEESIRRVTLRHEACAMSFAADGTVFRVGPPAPVAVDFVDLAGAEAPARLRQHCAAAVRRPFDLTRAPLLRIELIRLDDECHALLVVGHHLVFDGWSAAVFVDELARSYRAIAGGREEPLPPPQSYREFALAERERRGAAAMQSQLEYWQRIYADLPDALELPLDHPRPAQADFAADTVFHDFSAELTGGLRQFSRHQGVTLYSTLLAAFGVLVARLTGQSDFTIGIPLARQAASGCHALLGDGVNTLPVRLTIDAEEAFPALARRCHRALLDAAENQDLTLHTLRGLLGGGQRADRGGLTELIFALGPRVPALDFGALRTTVRDCAKAALVKELFFSFNDPGDRLTLDLHYRTSLFDAETISRWIGHYETLLVAVARGDAGPVHALPVLDAAQRHALVHEYNATAREFDLDTSLPALVRVQALRAPERIAAECGGRRLSYGDLVRRSDAVARALLAGGAVRGELVGVCLPRSIEMPVALLGVLAAGAAYVPLDPDYPQQHLRFVAEDTGVRHLLASRRLPVPPPLADRCRVHAIEDLDGAPEAPLELPHASGDDPAYVLYTSGSTGAPKGVRVLRRNLMNFLLSMRERPGLGRDDVLCAATALSFDIAALEMWLPLLVGARIVIATDEQKRDPDALIALLRESGATVLQATPSWLRLLVADLRARNLPRLKLLVGGEELPRGVADDALALCAELWNLYGPTETTVWSTVARVAPGEGSVPIGTPIANTRVYVLDAHRQLVPFGARGEIWIAGAGVADGYLGRPELTAERFCADPFAGGGEPMYRTGDIGSWGGRQLYFHGRVDQQIKIRGFRIEPGEIEAAACAEPGVRAALATLYAMRADDNRLVLYAVAPGAGTDFGRELRDRLRRRLPPHMVPQHVELLAELPRNAHGKVDRKALPAPGFAGRSADAPQPAAVSGNADVLTLALLEIWRDLLGIGEVRVDSNFFDLGGDSLLGVELFQRAHAAFGVNLPLSTLLTAQTVRDQVRVLREAGARAPGARVTALARGAADSWSPLVTMQPGGRWPPLFCVHALGGNVLNYVPLARALGTDQPVYGLQAIGLDGVTPALTTIEDMAARYLRDIRARFPHGPYYLSGGSMGGLIAFQIAHLLTELGERVPFLGLFDTYGANDSQLDAASRGVLARGLRRWRERWARMRSLDGNGRRTLLTDALAHRIDRGCDALQAAWFRWRGVALPSGVRYRELERAHQRADLAYRPKPYRGSITLFRATEHEAGASPTLGWDTVALGGIRVVDVRGSHDNLIEQPEFARALRDALELAHRVEGPSPLALRRAGRTS